MRRLGPRMRSLASSLWLVLALLAACRPAAPAASATALPSPASAASSAPSTATPSPSQPPTFTPTITPSPTPEPTWYQPLDESYVTLRYGYALVTDANAALYPTLTDAVQHSFNRGFLPYTPAYVAFYHTETRDGKTFYALASGEWMDGKDLQEITPSRFHGILLTRPVPFRFGWVLTDTHSLNRHDEPLRSFQRYQIVHEFPDVPPRAGYLAIGGDEWLPDEAVALVSPQTPSPAGPCRYIYVSLIEQTLSVYDHCQLVFATLVSTGQDKRWTPPGEFAILYKSPDKYITLSQPSEALSEYYLQAVPYFMSYYGNLAFHGAYWHDDFGAAVSHGCINLAPADARWLYEWARLGDKVIIRAEP